MHIIIVVVAAAAAAAVVTGFCKFQNCGAAMLDSVIF